MTKKKNEDLSCQKTEVKQEQVQDIESKEEAQKEDINKLLEQARQEAEDYKDHLQRLQAEFDNYKKRTAESSLCSRIDGICDVIIELIPAIDNLERGIEAVKDKSAKTGMELILKQLRKVLNKFDVCEIKALGECFNPDIHHAVAKDEESESENENKVTEVYLKGYQRKTKVLRPAMVKVTK